MGICSYIASRLHEFVCVCINESVCLCVHLCFKTYAYICVCVCVVVHCECEGQKSRKAAIVTFIDYGSVDSIPLKQLLPLDQVRVIKLYGYLSSRCFEISTK